MVLATDPLPSAISPPQGKTDGDSAMSSSEASPPHYGRRALMTAAGGWDVWPLSHLNDGISVMTSFSADVAKV